MPAANFYLAPTRVWELFAGSITAFAVQRNGVRKNELLSILGLSAIVLSIFVYDETTPFPSFYALVPRSWCGAYYSNMQGLALLLEES